jgi:ABC-2 type transport system permease protein
VTETTGGSTGAVYDLGYTPYEGERRGRRGARGAVFADGIRRVLGLRRKARKKILPWTLLAIAVLPPIAYVGISFFLPADVGNTFTGNTQHSQFFSLGGTIAMLFTALAAPELLIPDRKDGVLSMLSSRPLTSNDYLATRFASLVTIVGAFLLVPQLVLYIGQAATNPDGILRGLIDGADALPRVLAVAAIYTLAFVPIGFVVASLSNRKAVATSVYLAVMIGLTAFGEAIVQNATFAGGRWVALLAPINTADAANAWIFGVANSESLLADADIHPSLAVVALVVIAVAGTTFSVVRYRRLM